MHILINTYGNFSTCRHNCYDLFFPLLVCILYLCHNTNMRSTSEIIILFQTSQLLFLVNMICAFILFNFSEFILLFLVSFYSKFIILSFQISPFLPYPQLQSLYGVAKEPYLKGKLPLLAKIV